jgi:hypothetical protein
MEVVLKYRWITGLRSNPAEKNEPVKLADDSIRLSRILLRQQH